MMVNVIPSINKLKIHEISNFSLLHQTASLPPNPIPLPLFGQTS
jgi:hypothetical protein